MPETEPNTSELLLPGVPRLPTLDGWRAFSILFVLGAHCTITQGFPRQLEPVFRWLFDGSVGVRFFFVISGFLITWLLLIEGQRKGTVSLKHFYIRRALRILPVYAAFLTVLLALQSFTAFRLDVRSWLGSLTFTTNIVGSSSWTNGHLWSLAEEEQFYLLWPGLFLLSNAHTRVRTAAWLLSIPILICPFIRVLGYLRMMPPIFYKGLGISSCDSLAFGCATAIFFMHRRRSIEEFIAPRRCIMVLVGVGLILVPYVLTKLFVLGLFTVPLGESLQAAGFSILLLTGICHPDFAFFRILRCRRICEVGVLSYSIYIWQQVFCTSPSSFGIGHLWCLSFPWWLAAAFFAAFISYYALERPLFRLRRHFRE
jgi:peptidoglycan/LPS O-acetylase OafA/YrhL